MDTALSVSAVAILVVQACTNVYATDVYVCQPCVTVSRTALSGRMRQIVRERLVQVCLDVETSLVVLEKKRSVMEESPVVSQLTMRFFVKIVLKIVFVLDTV